MRRCCGIVSWAPRLGYWLYNVRRGLALAAVGGDIVEASEDLEGRVALDTVVTAEVGLLGAVNLGQSNVLLLEGCGGLLVLGCKSLAVSAPGGEDYTLLSDVC